MAKHGTWLGGKTALAVNEAVSRLEDALGGATDPSTVEREARALLEALRGVDLPLDALERVGRLVDLGLQAAALGHELRQPLLTIKGFVQLIQERPTDVEFIRTTTGTVVEQAAHMEAMLDRTRAYAHGGGADCSSCEMNAAVEASIATLNYQLRKRGLELVCDLGDDLPAVKAPLVVAQQILVNLIGNARDALGDGGGTIRVRTWDDEAVVAQVEDSGPGVPEGVDVFEPFVTSKDSGTGLGLWVSRTLAERAGGTLELVPSSAGAAFCLRLPKA